MQILVILLAVLFGLNPGFQAWIVEFLSGITPVALKTASFIDQIPA
jgi:hypothetical protein